MLSIFQVWFISVMSSKLIGNQVETMTWAWWLLFAGRACINIWSEMMRPIFPLHCTSQILLQADSDEVTMLSHAGQVFTLTLSSDRQLVHNCRICWQRKCQHYFNKGWLLLFPCICLRMEFYNFANLLQEILKKRSLEFAYLMADF